LAQGSDRPASWPIGPACARRLRMRPGQKFACTISVRLRPANKSANLRTSQADAAKMLNVSTRSVASATVVRVTGGADGPAGLWWGRPTCGCHGDRCRCISRFQRPIDRRRVDLICAAGRGIYRSGAPFVDACSLGLGARLVTGRVGGRLGVSIAGSQPLLTCFGKCPITLCIAESHWAPCSCCASSAVNAATFCSA